MTLFFILVKDNILINLIKVEEWDLNTNSPYKQDQAILVSYKTL